jgi:CheY-like chemotaxis protein
MPQGITCFLVDDDTDDLEIFAMAVAETGQSITCMTANDGFDALRLLNQDETFIPDFIFLDLNMPRMSGKQCLVEIKKIKRLMHIPVVIYSTSARQRDIDDTLKLGAAHFFTKPPSIPALTKALSGLLARHEILATKTSPSSENGQAFLQC